MIYAGVTKLAPALFSMPPKSPYDKVIPFLILSCLPVLLVAAIFIFGNL
jgi:hypothetical protein